LVKKGLDLSSLIYIALTSSISYFSGVFAKKARNLPVLIEREVVRGEFKKEWRCDEATGT